MRKLLIIIVGIVVVGIALLLIGGAIVKHGTTPRDSDSAADGPLLTANFVDLDQIAAMTKFRSCQGHLVVPQDDSEPRSNMKHYFYLKQAFTGAQGLVPLYAPFNGYVTDILAEDQDFSDRNPASRDVSLGTRKGLLARTDWQFTFLHIVPVESLKEGNAVTAGDLLGHVSLEKIPPYYAFDVTYSKMGGPSKSIDGWRSPYAALDSVFNHMDATVLADYQQRFGASSSDDFSVNPQARAAAPCQYQGNGPMFSNSRESPAWADDWLGTIEDAV